VLDAVPQAGATDLRKGRGALNNIVLTSTNAAAALELVMPEIAAIGFMADSVRIPTQSVSLIILNVTFQSEALSDGTVSMERDAINSIYKEAARRRGPPACSGSARSRTSPPTCWVRMPPWSSRVSRRTRAPVS